MTDQDPIAALVDWVQAQQPQSLLWVAPAAHALPDALQSATPRVERIAPTAWRSLGEQVFDVAVLMHALAELDRREGAELLARLRDVGARRILVAARTDGQWRRNDFLGYGFQLFGRFQTEPAPVAVYRFDLYDYKPVPEWLNARHWANPQLWGKYRW